MTVVLPLLFSLLTVLYPFYGEGGETLERAKDFVNKGRYEEVIGLLKNYRPSAEELPDYHYTLAKAYEKSKGFHDYIEHLRLSYIYSRKEERPGLLLERAEAYMGIGYYSEAFLVFRLFLKEFSDSPQLIRAHTGLGESLYKLGQYEGAVNHFSEGGDETIALYGLAKALQASGRTREAYEAFKKAIERDRDFIKTSEETLYRYSECLVMMKKYGEAYQYLNSIKDGRLRARADLLLGLISSEEGRYDDALRYLNSASIKGDRDTKRRSLFHMAELYLRKGKKKEAEEKLLELRLHYPYGKVYDKATLSLARLYRESGENIKAISLLKELVFRRPPDREAIDELESILLSAIKGDKEGLLHVWNSIGHWLLDPSRSGTLIRVAQALRGSGTPFLKLASWLVRHGDSISKERAGMLLAALYVDLGEPAKAGEYLRSSGKMTGRNEEDFYRIKAALSLLNSNPKDALDSLLSIRDLKREDLRLVIETFYLMRERYQKESRRLIDQFKRAFEKGGINEYVSFADLLYDLGRKEEALSYYRKAISEKERNGYNLEIDWACYRINHITKEGDVIPMITGDRLKRLGEALSKELEIEKTVKEVF